MKSLYRHYHSKQDRLLVNQELLLLTMGMMAMVITLMMGRASKTHWKDENRPTTYSILLSKLK